MSNFNELLKFLEQRRTSQKSCTRYVFICTIYIR